MMFDDLWPCKYRVENIYLSRRFIRFFRVDIPFSFVNLLNLSSVLRCYPSLLYASLFIFVQIPEIVLKNDE